MISIVNRKFYWLWAILFLLVFIPNLYAFFYDVISLKSVLSLILGIAFCLFPALFFKSKIYFGIFLPFVLLAPLEIGHIIVNKTSMTSIFMLILLNTNANEIISYLSSFKIMIVLAIIYWALYIFLWIKIPNRYLLNGKKKIIGIWFYVVLLVGILALAIASAIILSEKSNKIDVAYSIRISFKTKLLQTYPYNIIIKTNRTLIEKREFESRLERIKDFKFNPVPREDDEYETYVFVMGESARYDNFGINGYERNTTPFLDSLKKEDKLLTFSNVFASANLTKNVHPLMLTRATVLKHHTANNEKSIISLFKETGFKTYVLSNQGENEVFLRQMATEADYSFLNNNDYKFDEKYDGLLLPHIDSVLNEKEKKKCLFLFTLGSHFKYNFRYPPPFEKFKPAGSKSHFTYELVEKNKDLFVNAYDNSILYTDYFIHEIIKKLESQNGKTLLFYVSDHGQKIFDAPGINVGHGGLQPTKQELHTPMFIWFSDSYVQTNDSVVMNLRNNIDKRINSTNVFYTFANIAGIKYDLYQKDKDVSAKTFVPDSVHWVLNPDLEVLRINGW